MFDWYVSPADAFRYEHDFDVLTESNCSDTVLLEQLEPLVQAARLQPADVSTMYALLDTSLQGLNRREFVYFMHLVASRRRGIAVPVAVPLSVKEQCINDLSQRKLPSRPLHNPIDSHSQDSLQALAKRRDQAAARVFELQMAVAQVEQIGDYKQRQLDCYLNNAPSADIGEQLELVYSQLRPELDNPINL